MKTLEKDELFRNLQGFLQSKGIDLKKGSYAQTIQKSCSVLSDAINVGQEGLTQAKVHVDKKLDRLRQIIHEKTAPPGPPGPRPASDPAPAAEPTNKKKPRKSKQPGARKRRKRA